MEIYALRDRVTIQRRGVEKDALGEIVAAWVDVATVWAKVTDVNGREYLTADATQNKTRTKVLIRHRHGIEPAMRVVHGETIYNIEAVLNPSGRRSTYLLMCSKGLIE